jgi:hypothetical protein
MKNNIAYLTILFLLLMMSSCTDEVEAPENALCTKDAQTLEDNYIKHQCNVDDYRAISFTYLQMKEYMEYLAFKRKGLRINEEDLGVRIYFGAKEEKEFGRDVSPKGSLKGIDHADELLYTTIFFAPTIKRADSENSEDPGDYENMYEIAPFNHGSSRRPPNPYFPSEPCPLIDVNGHSRH